MTKNKILLVSHHQNPKTGAHFRWDRLVHYLAEQEKTILWISPIRDEFTRYSNVEFLKLKQPTHGSLLEIRLLLLTVRYIPTLWKHRNCIEYIVTFGETNLLAAFFTSWLVKAPLSIGVRSNLVRRKTLQIEAKDPVLKLAWSCILKIRLFIYRLIYTKAHQVTVQTELAKSQFIKQFNLLSEKVWIIENDLPPHLKELNNNKLYPNYYQINPIRKMIFVGNQTNIKGFDILIQAVPKIKNCVCSLQKITIVGVPNKIANTIDNELKKQCQIEIECHPWHNNVPELMKEHDLLVVPSREDQFPNVILEALAVGLPVIGSAVDGIKSILSDHHVLFMPGDPDELTNCFCRVAEPKGYAKAIEIAQQRAKQFNFCWEAHYLQILNEINKESL